MNVATNGNITLAPGAYRDLLVAKKGIVTFTGGTYVFRSVVIQREASLLFKAPSTVKVAERMSTATMTKIQPATVSTATAATIVFHIAGINGSNGALASTPKSVEIATDNVLQANFYAPNGTLWIQARTLATGAFIGRHVRIGPTSRSVSPAPGKDTGTWCRPRDDRGRHRCIDDLLSEQRQWPESCGHGF